MPENELLVETDGPIMTISINRPQARNALNLAIAEAFHDAVRRFEADNELCAAVVTGTNGAFCAGADLREMAEVGAVYRPWAGANGPLANPPAKPVIAAVEGHAVAGGLGLALWCDMRVASETAVFGVFCRRFGVPMSDGTTVRLPQVVGLGRALDMLNTGRPVNAQEALAFGLANYVVPAGQARAEAEKIARQISAFPQIAMRADRISAIESQGIGTQIALVNEAEGVAEAKALEAASGAKEFASGKGKGGAFD